MLARVRASKLPIIMAVSFILDAATPRRSINQVKQAATCAALRHPPLLRIRCDKASVLHLVRNRDVARSLYGALQPPDRFIDPVFLALGISPRLFTTH
jgi:hypothetical protein